MKFYRYIFFVFIFVLLLFPSSCFASAKTYTRTKDDLLIPDDVVVDNDRNTINNILRTPAVDSNEKIYDFADLLSEEEEKDIYKKIKEFIDDSKFDVVIILTKDLKGFSINDYSYYFYDYNDFKKAGITLTIYINEDNKPELFMANSSESSSEIFSLYDDKRINMILEYIYINYIEKGEYYNACTGYIKIVQAFYKKVHGGDYKVDEDGNVVKSIPWVDIVVISSAVTFIVVLLLLCRNKNMKIVSNEYVKKSVNYNTMIVKCENDQSITK